MTNTNALDHLFALKPKQRKMIRELSLDMGSSLGCSEKVAIRLCAETSKRPALVWRAQRQGDWVYRLTPEGVRVQRLLDGLSTLAGHNQ